MNSKVNDTHKAGFSTWIAHHKLPSISKPMLTVHRKGKGTSEFSTFSLQSCLNCLMLHVRRGLGHLKAQKEPGTPQLHICVSAFCEVYILTGEQSGRTEETTPDENHNGI